MGAIIAVIGLTARTTLRKTPVFADAKHQLQESLADAIEKGDVNIKKPFSATRKGQEKNLLGLFFN